MIEHACPQEPAHYKTATQQAQRRPSMHLPPHRRSTAKICLHAAHTLPCPSICCTVLSGVCPNGARTQNRRTPRGSTRPGRKQWAHRPPVPAAELHPDHPLRLKATALRCPSRLWQQGSAARPYANAAQSLYPTVIHQHHQAQSPHTARKTNKKRLGRQTETASAQLHKARGWMIAAAARAALRISRPIRQSLLGQLLPGVNHRIGVERD